MSSVIHDDINLQHVDAVEGSIINVDRQDGKHTRDIWASSESITLLRQKISVWFFAFLYILFSLWIAYLLVWNRGLYLDDYYFKSAAQDLATATWKPLFKAPIPNVRELGQIIGANLASAIPSYEFYVRLLWTIVHGSNVILLGMILYRITYSRIAGFIAATLYIAPFSAHEALLWHFQGLHMLSTSFFLLTTYLFILVIEKRKYWIVYLISGVLLIALALQFSELPIPAIGILVPLAFATSLRPGEWGYWRKRTLTASFLAFTGVVVCLIHYVIFTGRSIAVERRGGLTLNPALIFEKYVHFLKAFYWYTLDSEWGLLLARESLILGINIIIESRIGLFLLILSFLCCILWLARVSLPKDNIRSVTIFAFVIVFIGILWIFASLIPGTVIRGQILEWRMLYYALAGLAVVIGGITWGGLVLSQNMPSWVRRTFLALPLSTAILATITMLGYAEVYRLRSQLDQQQITELVSVVTPQSLTSDTTFIPINPAIKITKNDPSVITVHDRVLFGVFEIHWAGKSALRMAYRRPDIDVVATHHWTTPMAFRLVESPEGMMILKVNDRLVPLKKALPFTYRNGRAVLLSPLILVAPDGTVVDSIDIPLVEMYRAEGAPTESIQVPAIP